MDVDNNTTFVEEIVCNPDLPPTTSAIKHKKPCKKKKKTLKRVEKVTNVCTPFPTFGSQDSRRAIFAEMIIPQGTKFGPFPGEDGLTAKHSNWMRYVNGVKNVLHGNLMIFYLHGQMYFHCYRTIYRNRELLLWFGNKNPEELGLTEDSVLKIPTAPSFKDTELYICFYCGKNFKKAVCLRAHCHCVHEAGLNDKIYCRHCPFVATALKFMDRHLFLHSGIKPYSCSVCSKSFALKWELQCHTPTHFKSKFKCPKCFKNHLSQLELDGHKCGSAEPIEQNSPQVNSTARKTLPGSKPHKCSVCSHRFQSQLKLKVHMTIHTGEKKYHCSLCSKKFRLSQHLAFHMQVHNKPKFFNCLFCPKLFCEQKSWRTHTVKEHVNAKDRRCPICQKLFKVKTNMVKHLFLHLNIRPYVCNVCRNSFARKDNLLSHMKIHKS